MNQTPATGTEWILDADAVAALLKELGFREEIVDCVTRTAREVSQSEELPRFLRFCRDWIENPAPVSQGEVPQSWQILTVVAAFPQTLKKHRARAIPFSITSATLLDMQRWMEEYFERTGVWAFEKLNWLRNHIGGEFFQIGRLQYHLGKFEYLARVYRDAKTNKIMTLALAGRQCTPDGWPVDGATGFETTFEERRDGIYGHMISPDDGAISPHPTKLHPDSEVVLGHQFSICHIHIPAGDKLDAEACVASMREAKEFFANHFPEINLRGYVTATWLLDRELARVLPPHSNIAAFGKLFRPLPIKNGNDHQLLERAFGPEATWENCRAQTSLQKAVLEHHRKGGQFRVTAGFVLMDEIESPATQS